MSEQIPGKAKQTNNAQGTGQRLIQIGLLLVFLLLMRKGRPQLWMGVFLSGVLLSFWLGRLYCGYACPINTILQPITWLKKKLKIKDRSVPAVLTKPAVRILSFALFISLFAFTIITKKRLPVLPAMVLVGVVLTLFWPEELWHRCLCPYGLLLSFPSRRTKHGMTVDQDLCINCTKCAKVCPARAVLRNDKHEVLKEECLVCNECSRACSKDAISYK